MKNILKSVKQKWEAYLKRLAESNQKMYGSGRLDCCDLNKSKKKSD